MIKYVCKDGNVEELEVSGKIVDLVADVSLLAHIVYNELFSDDEDATDMFKTLFREAVDDGNIVFRRHDKVKKVLPKPTYDDACDALSNLVKAGVVNENEFNVLQKLLDHVNEGRSKK